MKTEKHEYRITLRVPASFYFTFSKIKEDAFRQGKKVFVNDIILDAVKEYFQSHGYPEIACDN